ncbi:hypothetical protein OXE08_004536 [Salmonella enterica]|nr:hypothetical protein [Salmonella enterica]
MENSKNKYQSIVDDSQQELKKLFELNDYISELESKIDNQSEIIRNQAVRIGKQAVTILDNGFTIQRLESQLKEQDNLIEIGMAAYNELETKYMSFKKAVTNLVGKIDMLRGQAVYQFGEPMTVADFEKSLKAAE